MRAPLCKYWSVGGLFNLVQNAASRKSAYMSYVNTVMCAGHPMALALHAPPQCRQRVWSPNVCWRKNSQISDLHACTFYCCSIHHATLLLYLQSNLLVCFVHGLRYWLHALDWSVCEILKSGNISLQPLSFWQYCEEKAKHLNTGWFADKIPGCLGRKNPDRCWDTFTRKAMQMPHRKSMVVLALFFVIQQAKPRCWPLQEYSSPKPCDVWHLLW